MPSSSATRRGVLRLASLILLHQHLLVGRFAGELPAAIARGAALGIPFIVLLCAFAMVSSIPYMHVTNRYIYGARSFGYVVRLVVLLALVVWFPPETFAILFTAYALSGPVAFLRRTRRGQGSGVRGQEERNERPSVPP